ncbi:ABC transporter substrate-binding protein [Vogesella sp. LIG4]|uniref:substrate-binding periplasmic protein n=1 Tax=Vogesella sp. LIG4 TaxID=1192162 RepID=UPI00081FA9F8|nr:transporter substrate-binding domain-containing protein [Vogesella sp. LIG4]SCK05250.1 ABC-type amino acid transport substrate-binding protein [Vogesella sp. LIG4]
MRRRQLLAALLLAPLLALPAARAASLDDIRATGTLKVAVYRDFPPFSFVQGGELVGIDVELARAIGKKLALPVSFMTITPADDVDGDLRNAVWKGHYLGGGTADLMLHVPFDPELARRNDNAVLFGAYYREQLAWAGNKLPASVQQIDTQRVALENDSLGDLYLSALQGGRLRGQLQHYPDTSTACRAVADGRAEIAFGTRSELEWGLYGSQVQLGQPQLPGVIKPSWEIGMATKESLHDLAWAVGDALTELRSSGELAAIFQHYHASYRPADEH